MAVSGETPKKVISRAATGAAIGSVVPGVGTLIGGAAGGIEGFLEDLFSSSDGGQSATDAAGAEKLRRMEEGAKILASERDKRKQMQLNMLANRMGAYQGANNVMASMYGPRGSMAPNLNLRSGGPTMGTTPPRVGAPGVGSMPGAPGGITVPGGLQNPTSARALAAAPIPPIQPKPPQIGNPLVGAMPGTSAGISVPGGLQDPTSARALAAAPIPPIQPKSLDPAVQQLAALVGGGQFTPPPPPPAVNAAPSLRTGGTTSAPNAGLTALASLLGGGGGAPLAATGISPLRRAV